MGEWYVWPVDSDGHELASVSVVEADSPETACAAADEQLPMLRDMPRRTAWRVRPRRPNIEY